MTTEEIKKLADQVANDAIYQIQNAIGVQSGDFAGIYFSGDKWEVLLSIFEDYTTAEINKGN
jgi:hypothetical protein